MKHVRIELSKQAKGHLARIKRWSRDHGVLPVLQAEYARIVLGLLADHPEAGHVHEPDPRYRRILMPRSQLYVYYRFDRELDIVLIVAVWHTARGTFPRL